MKQDFGKRDAPDTVAESWELASHPDGESQVESGEWIGWTIKKLGELDHDGFWGTSCEVGRFPLIVKLIDAQRDLSIQVHPSDQSALPEEGEQGKAEMWYIVDCEPQAFLYLGFSRCITREEFLQRAQDGSICEVLKYLGPGDKGRCVLYYARSDPRHWSWNFGGRNSAKLQHHLSYI